MPKIKLLLVLLVSQLVVSCFTFDDGPFEGSAVSSRDIEGLYHPDYSLEYKKGILEIHNRDSESFPVILYKLDDGIIWAAELNTSRLEPYENTFFEKMEHPELSSGIFRDRIDFTGYWSYGAEHGYAYFTKRRFIEFYLSW